MWQRRISRRPSGPSTRHSSDRTEQRQASLCLKIRSKQEERLQYFREIILLFYIVSIALSLSQFYTLKWLLLSSDIILIVGFLSVCVAHIIYAAVAGERTDFHYLILVTGMLLWNYISYFWSETSVYWGNSAFIRTPMDLTIVVWMAINAVNLVYSYRKSSSRPSRRMRRSSKVRPTARKRRRKPGRLSFGTASRRSGNNTSSHPEKKKL